MRARIALPMTLALHWAFGAVVLPPAAAEAATPVGRYVVHVPPRADYAAVRAALVRSGAKVVKDLPQIGVLVVNAPAETSARVAAAAGVERLVPDGVVRLSPPEGETRPQSVDAPGLRSAITVPLGAPAKVPPSGIQPDPDLGQPDLLWDFQRIGLPAGWKTSAGDPAVTVAVADTGVDFTHAELKPVVAHVEDLTLDDSPSICTLLNPPLPTDRQLAAKFKGPVSTDWNGHGSWIGGNIAAALNSGGINGIAPKVRLVAIKIAENCGYSYFSNELDAFVWAADNGVDIVSISFGGYVDRSNPDANAFYQDLVNAVAYARSHGTLIVAAAGNDHARIGAGGQVLSHGTATLPGAALVDRFGQYEIPGGLAGVVDVASTGNQVNPSSASCPRGSTGGAADLDDTGTCKPRSDRHQAAGQGLADQLAYYSNYGPRIDVAAPGGARKFNLSYWDTGGTPGFPYVTTEGTKVWEEFSTTSNFATDEQCYIFPKGSGFPQRQCYTSLQGTSMATPHVSAVAALLASANPSLRHNPDGLAAALKAHTRNAHNLTKVLSATDRTPGDLTGVPCGTGYCHLGGKAVPDGEAYGAGIVETP